MVAYDLLEDRDVDDVIDILFLFLYYIKTIAGCANDALPTF